MKQELIFGTDTIFAVKSIEKLHTRPPQIDHIVKRLQKLPLKQFHLIGQ